LKGVVQICGIFPEQAGGITV